VCFIELIVLASLPVTVCFSFSVTLLSQAFPAATGACLSLTSRPYTVHGLAVDFVHLTIFPIDFIKYFFRLRTT